MADHGGTCPVPIEQDEMSSTITATNSDRSNSAFARMPKRTLSRRGELDPAEPIDFRYAMSRFATGLVIVTTNYFDDPVGMTCQSFSSLSLSPPLIMFAPGLVSTTFPRIRSAKQLCVNVLAQDQAELAARFAGGGDRWSEVPWCPGENGTPRLRGALAWYEGDIDLIYAGGDHYIVVVRVTALAAGSSLARPLIFHQARYTGLDDKPSEEVRS